MNVRCKPLFDTLSTTEIYDYLPALISGIIAVDSAAAHSFRANGIEKAALVFDYIDPDIPNYLKTTLINKHLQEAIMPGPPYDAYVHYRLLSIAAKAFTLQYGDGDGNIDNNNGDVSSDGTGTSTDKGISV